MTDSVLECNLCGADAARIKDASHLDSSGGGRNLNRPESTISIGDLELFSRGYLYWCRANQLPNTAEDKADVIRLLLWFLNREGYRECGVGEILAFQAHVRTGHLEPGGRFGNHKLTKPVGQRTMEYYYVYLHGLFKYFLREEVITVDPFVRIPPVKVVEPKIQAPPEAQVLRMMEAACRSPYAQRDRAMLAWFYDTGVRVSEFCSLNYGDIDFEHRKFEVTGKKDKKRTVHFSPQAGMLVWQYTVPRRPNLDDPLFLSESGIRPKTRMTRRGVLDRFWRLCEMAGVPYIGPHAFRRACTVALLNNGANVLSVQDLMGHEDLRTTRKYAHMAGAEIAKQHQKFSPLSNLTRNSTSIGTGRRG